MSRAHPESGNNRAPGSHLSWSAIRTFRTCPLQYFFKYKACLPAESISPNLVLGAAIHRALEVHFRGWLQLGQPPAMDELLDAFWAEFRARQLKERDLDGDEQASLTSQHGTAQRLLELFRNSRFARPVGRILAVEESFRAQIVDRLPDFHGIVELAVETPQEIVVYDWKTARAHWSAPQLEQGHEQLLVYGELVRHLAPRKPVRLEVVLLIKTKVPSIDHHSWLLRAAQLHRIQQVIRRVSQAIEAQSYYPAPSPAACSSCGYRNACKKWPG